MVKIDLTEKSNAKVIPYLIEELKRYDNKEGYRLSYGTVKKKLEETSKQLTGHGEKSLEHLHSLLKNEETWSCLFALEILKEIKSEKSIIPLINFIKNNEYGDRWESCEEAMYGLNAIGEPAIEPLLSEIKSNFKQKTYYGYLIGSVTGIKHDKVYSFMKEILQDYLKDYQKYDGWFEVDNFTYDFEVQGEKEALPLLKRLAVMEHLSEHERMEIKSTIEVIEDPEKFNQEIDEMSKKFKKYDDLKKQDINEKELLEQAVDFEEKKEYESALECITKILAVYPKSYHALFLNARINRKLEKPNLLILSRALDEAKKQKASQEVMQLIEEERKKISELFREKEQTADENLELNFRCLDCDKRQNLKPGLIWDFGDEQYTFENEVMCRHCFSHNLELTKDGEMEIFGQKMRLMRGLSTGVVNAGEEVFAENKKMKLNKVLPYLNKRLQQNPSNGELHLRYANALSKQNKYDDAIKHYKKSIELNPKLIAVYANLITIYGHRHKYYRIEEAKKETIDYCKKLRELYDSGDYNNATIADKLSLIEFIREKEVEFGLSKDIKKISKGDIGKIIRKTSTLDIDSISLNINKNMIKSENEIKNLLEQNQGVLVYEDYLAFDKETNESNRIQSSYLMPIDISKVCICGSGEYLKKCCFEKVRSKSIFAANTDYENHSVLEEIKKEIDTNESYLELARKFKEDSRFYCEEEKRNSSMFLYHGPHIFTQELGTVIFGNITIKRNFFDNKGRIVIEALSKNRFDAINSAVEENL